MYTTYPSYTQLRRIMPNAAPLRATAPNVHAFCNPCFRLAAGYPPFFSDDPLTTCRKIVNWRLFLKYPEEIKISPAAHDLISRLMCDVDERLGTNGVQVWRLCNHWRLWVDIERGKRGRLFRSDQGLSSS